VLLRGPLCVHTECDASATMLACLAVFTKLELFIHNTKQRCTNTHALLTVRVLYTHYILHTASYMRSSWSGSDSEFDGKARRRSSSTTSTGNNNTTAATGTAVKARQRKGGQWQEQKDCSVKGIYHAVGMQQVGDGYYYVPHRSTHVSKKSVTADSVVGPFVTCEAAAMAKHDAAQGQKRPPDFAKEVCATLLQY
jgi:hypothetical protein